VVERRPEELGVCHLTKVQPRLSRHEVDFCETHEYGRTALMNGDERVESTQLARGTLKRYLSILKRLIFESRVRAGRPSFVAAPEGPETRP